MPEIPLPSEALILSGGVAHNQLLKSHVDSLIKSASFVKFLDHDYASETLDDVERRIVKFAVPVEKFRFSQWGQRPFIFQADSGIGAIHFDVASFGGGLFVPDGCSEKKYWSNEWSVNRPMDSRGMPQSNLQYNQIMTISCDSYELGMISNVNSLGELQLREIFVVGR